MGTRARQRRNGFMLATLLLCGGACGGLSPEEEAYVRELMQHRTARDRFLLSEQSPLQPEQRSRFKGLAYFNADFDLIFDVELEPLAAPDTLQLLTTTGTFDPYLRFARLRFRHRERDYELTVYTPPNRSHLFLPFADATSGEETYGAGRYIDLEPLGGRRYRLDFNRAYNPYCAYNATWACPITPAENRLDMAIRAGERNFPNAPGH